MEYGMGHPACFSVGISYREEHRRDKGVLYLGKALLLHPAIMKVYESWIQNPISGCVELPGAAGSAAGNQDILQRRHERGEVLLDGLP